MALAGTRGTVLAPDLTSVREKTMNKIIGFGVAVVLCMTAAGFGAYLALRPQPAAVPVAATGEAGKPAVQVASGTAGVTSPAETPVPGSTPAVTASAQTAVEAPKVAQADRPAPSPRPVDRAVAGGTTAVPPASEDAAAAERAAASAPPEVPPVAPPVAEPVLPPEPPPPQKSFEELVVSADSVIGLRIESTVSSEVAKVEDPVDARVTRDVRVGSVVVIPSGSRVLGSVIQVERGGR
jgi:hypothetical protein